MSEPLPPRALEKLMAEASPEAPAPIRIGRYRVIREVGRGGMGTVHEAFDEDLGRRVALKVLSAPLADERALTRFVREARAAARLDHPGIAAVYEAGVGWIAMRFVDGAPLSRGERCDVRTAVGYVRDAALAVHAAHEQGIVHRDLKPANLLLEGDRVVVTDFGLAKDAASEGDLSLSGHVLGTPSYMAPEQARGDVRAVDARTDVWGLGATLFDLLAGRPPFVEADVPSLLRAVVEREPPPLRSLRPEVPRDLETVVRKCLEKDRERRYASALDLAADLIRWLAGEPVRARPPSIGYRVSKFARRRRGALVAASVAALILVVALDIAWSEWAQKRASKGALDLSQLVASVLSDAEMHRRHGEIELAAARLDEGIGAARDYLARYEVSEAQALLGRLLRARGRESEARSVLDRAVELNPELVEARLERGLLVAGELAEQRAAELPPRGIGPADGKEGEERARHALASADLAIVASRPERLRVVDAEFARAQLARLAGDRPRARKLLEEVLREDPVRYEAKVALSQLELVDGDPQLAFNLAMSAIDLHRGFAPAYLARADDASRPSDGRRPLASVEIEGAECLFADTGAAIRSAPSDATAHANRALVLARRAAQLAREGWTAQALDVWESSGEGSRSALVLDTGLVEARVNLAAAHAERARLLDSLNRRNEGEADRKRALAELDALVAAEPATALAWLNRAIVRVPNPALRADLQRALEGSADARTRRKAEALIAAAR